MTEAGASSIPPAIAVRGLRKVCGDTVVLDSVDLTVSRGSLCALLGPNGAGKTTTVQILSTLIPADAGGLSDVGADPAAPGEPQGLRYGRVASWTG